MRRLLALLVTLLVLGCSSSSQDTKEMRMVVPAGYDCFMVGNQVVCHPVIKEMHHGNGLDRP